MTTTRRHAVVLLALAVVALAAPPAVAEAIAASSLADRIARLIDADRELGKATIGVHVREVATGRSLFGRNATDPLIPASNHKLLTTGAAAMVLGPDAVFSTRIAARGDTVVVIGSGDPGFADPELLRDSVPSMSVEDLLGQLADAIDQRLDRVAGIVIDDRVFDRERVHPSWPTDQLNRWYCAEVSGLNFHTNCLLLVFEPRAAGASAEILPSPALTPGAGWYGIANRTRTVEKGRNTVWVARPAPENTFTAYGDVLSGVGASVDVAVHQPGLFFGTVLAERLAQRGLLEPADAATAARYAGDDETFDDAEVIAEVRTGMVDALRRANTNSQNLYTEALLKRLGHEITGEPGSWSNGAAVVRMLIAERLGPDHASAVTIADGSGMSRDNTIAPATLTAWIAHVAELDRVGPMFIDSLPTVGEGTLRSRFNGVALDNTVRAKSGTIAGVRCLSGLVISDDDPDEAVAFSVLVNDLPDGRAVRAAKRLHERIVAEIDRWLTANATPAYGG